MIQIFFGEFTVDSKCVAGPPDPNFLPPGAGAMTDCYAKRWIGGKPYRFLTLEGKFTENTVV